MVAEAGPEARDVLVVGEALVDVVRAPDGTTREHAGGSAANVAVALARLGRPVRLATAYAADDRGALLARHLDAAGVALATDPAVLARTSAALATIGAGGAATYEFDLSWELGPVADEPAPLHVHACSLGAVVAPGAEDVAALLRRLRDRATVSYDVNARPAVTGTGADVVARVERVAALADLVKASDEDLAALWPDLDEASAVAHLLALGPGAVVVTRGADGAAWTGAGRTVEVASLPVEVADTIGAGDTFGAALVDALWERGLLGAERRERLRGIGEVEVAEVLEHAARAAAVTVSRPGADPPYRHEL
ncbi:carbohydrate kinase family protein [Nocardioides marmotae]|uniref:carbohydrate kinase family protein n=1 Tax=Nocardioides marmotae TaxID=2663857 RepID=UPI0012B5843E|nr:carbohydrate kinase [Nocardioides marmotae]MBC9733783.1 carbohydrate kinase [Nocardioides marmotae]MTB84886.1 carbohydrate kinase [Nocardioides marmotae]